MANVAETMPALEIEAFKSRKKFEKAISKNHGIRESVTSGFFCSTFPDEEYCRTKSYILIEGFDGTIDHVAALAHEVSHAVDHWFDRMEEEKPGTEVRAYAMQAAMTACLEQLMD